MRVLLIGYSDIARRRIIPALCSMDQVSQIDVATRSRAAHVQIAGPKQGQVYQDIPAALATQPDLVYVSTRNSEHVQHAEEALRAGCHVVVDKPATMGLDSAEMLTTLAAQNNLFIAESTVYAYHKQIAALRDILTRADDAPIRLSATFSFPQKASGNYRNDPRYGGGALLDLGPYAMSLGRIFFGDAEITQLSCTIGSSNWVETAFSLLVHYDNGGTLVGHFGFDTGYCNSLQILGQHTALHAERIFTTPPAHQNTVQAQQGFKRQAITLPEDDAFVSFFQQIFDGLARGNFGRFADTLLTDARALQQLRHAAMAQATIAEGILQ